MSTIKVMSYNVRHDRDDVSPNLWNERRDEVVGLIRRTAPDLLGTQETYPHQLEYLKEKFPEYEFIGVPRNDIPEHNEMTPVIFRRDRFEALKSGTFWLSETPDIAGSISWNSAVQRIASWVLLKEKKTGRQLGFFNTHTDHRSDEARVNGENVVLAKIKELMPPGIPIVLTGDHNCTEVQPPIKELGKVLKDAMFASETPPVGPWRTFNGWVWRDQEEPTQTALMRTPELRNCLNTAVTEPGNRTYRDVCGGVRIDYIFVDNATIVKTFETLNDHIGSYQCYPSDHFPVVSVIEGR